MHSSLLADKVGTRFLQFIPIVERAPSETIEIASAGCSDRNHGCPLYMQDGSVVAKRTVTPDLWDAFLIGIFDEWVARDVHRVFVQMFESALASWMGLPFRFGEHQRGVAAPE